MYFFKEKIHKTLDDYLVEHKEYINTKWIAINKINQ